MLISGASGTGKELVARAIHERSTRSDGPFVAVNCSAIPETLLESSLFGHVKGAFTGATRDTEGYLGRASGGTLFLDEIGDVTPDVQVKLLRFLQELRYERVGEARARSANVRIVAATNQDMEDLVQHGQVREDFYYRISVFPIAIPPLSKRRSDLPPLVEHVLRRVAERSGGTPPGVDAEVIDIFRRYDWPGNVRELENVLEYAFVVAQGRRLVVADLPDPFFTRATTASRPAGRARRDRPARGARSRGVEPDARGRGARHQPRHAVEADEGARDQSAGRAQRGLTPSLRPPSARGETR